MSLHWATATHPAPRPLPVRGWALAAALTRKDPMTPRAPRTMTPDRAALLYLLTWNGPATVRALAEMAGVGVPLASASLAMLDTYGYVTGETVQDRRVYTATPAGTAWADAEQVAA